MNDVYETNEVHELNDNMSDKKIIKSLKRQSCIKKGIHEKLV